MRCALEYLASERSSVLHLTQDASVKTQREVKGEYPERKCQMTAVSPQQTRSAARFACAVPAGRAESGVRCKRERTPVPPWKRTFREVDPVRSTVIDNEGGYRPSLHNRQTSGHGRSGPSTTFQSTPLSPEWRNRPTDGRTRRLYVFHGRYRQCSPS